MERPAKRIAGSSRDDGSRKIQSDWRDTALQFSLIWFFAALTWHLLGPEPETVFDHRLQLGAVGLGYSLSIGLWILRLRSSPIFKIISIAAMLFVGLIGWANSAREFRASFLVLEPGHVRQGRIVHDGIGLSYVKLSDCQIDLRPVIGRSRVPQVNHKTNSSSRLQFGGEATLCQIALSPQSRDSQPRDAVIVLRVLRDRAWALDKSFVRIREHELNLARQSDVRIIQQTRHSWIAGLDMIEFAYVDGQQRMNRQVVLRTGEFALNFSLNTANDADCSRFDELLNSIRLDSVPGIGLLAAERDKSK